MKTHSLFEAEDRAAEEFLLGARKHLFLANNLFFLLSFAREKRAELQSVQDRGASGAVAKVCFDFYIVLSPVIFRSSSSRSVVLEEVHSRS